MGLHLFIRTCIREEKKSYKNQTGEIVSALTGTDLLPSPQGHKVSLLMHAVKGNLANTVCKRKHQHIASVLVLSGPCLLFSNFYSFLWGLKGEHREGDRFFFFPPPPLLILPSVTLTQSQGRGGGLSYRDACRLAYEAKAKPCAGQQGLASVAHTSALHDNHNHHVRTH